MSTPHACTADNPRATADRERLPETGAARTLNRERRSWRANNRESKK